MIRRKRRLQPLIPLASMGDIAFLLIIFFILTSSFIEGDNARLTPARSPDIDEVRRPAAVSVSVDTRGVVRLQGVEMPVVQLEASVEALLGERKDRRVKVSIDKDLTKQDFLPVIEALSVERFAWDVELCLLAHGSGRRVAEVPVVWRNSPESKVSLVRDPLEMLRQG